MSTWTELQFVLRMRDEAAEILRKHNEATSRVGAAYAAVTRQVESFRESLQLTVKGVTSLTGAVRAAGGDSADGIELGTRNSVEERDRARALATAKEAVREQSDSRAKGDRQSLVLQSRAFSGAGEIARGGDVSYARQGMLEKRTAADVAMLLAEIARRGTIAAPAERTYAVGATTSGGRQDAPSRHLEREASPAAPDRRKAAAALQPPDLRFIGELRAAFDATLRTYALLIRRSPRIAIAPQDIALLDEASERNRSTTTTPKRAKEPETAADGTVGPTVVAPGGTSLPPLERVGDRWNREVLPQIDLDGFSSTPANGAERLEAIAEIREMFTSLGREMRKALVPSREWPEIAGDRKTEERAFELLRAELRRLAPNGRAFEEVAADRGAWLQENRPVVADAAESRLPSAVVAPKAIGSNDADGNATGAYVQDVTADWRAYGNGIASALGATDQVLTGILTQTRDWRAAMHSLIKSVVADFARIAIRQNVTGPLAEAMFGAGQKGGDAGLLGRALGWVTSLFADGGVMTARGPLPLRTYASGGIATSPQLALFGEGSTPEAYVPVPSGRIPVTLRGGMGIGSIATNIAINVTSGGSTSEPAVGSDPAELARNIGALVAAAFNRNLAEQMRPGGMLNPAGYLGNGLAR